MLHRRGSAVLPRVFLVAAALVGATFVTPTSAVSAATPDKPNVGPVSELAGPPLEKEIWNPVDNVASVAPTSDFAELRTKAAKTGKVQVIVGLRMSHTAEGGLSTAAVGTQRATIQARTAAVRAAVAGPGVRLVTTFETVPYVALELTPAALDRLRASGLAASVQVDGLAKPTLGQSSPLIEATESWAMGRHGGGMSVAILDTGVQKNHPFLYKANGSPKVAAEACYAANGTCPGGSVATTAPGSGAPCLGTTQCYHGTHVAGIAAGRGNAFSGVARESGILSMRVFSVFRGSSTCGGPEVCALSYTSDQIRGLERVYALRTKTKIAAANMSLGSLDVTSRPCDTDPRKSIIDTLRSVGIATVISSGNSSSNSGVSFPGCITTAVTVGSTTKSDAVSTFSNSSSYVDLLAPGQSINSSIPGSKYAVMSGTSMAAPQVAGAWAVLKGIKTSASVATVLSALQATGKGVKDPDNGVLKRRIQVLSAGVRLGDTGLRYAANFTGTNLDLTSDGIGLARRDGASATGSFRIGAIPSGRKVYLARLVWTTIGGADPVVTFNGRSVRGALVGAARPTCTNLNTGQPNRTYIAAVTVPRNGIYTIGGVGSGNIDGQGASLLVLFTSTAGGPGKVTARFGAVAALPTGGTLVSNLPTTGNGKHIRLPGLHYGIGDASSSRGEYSMYFNNKPVTPQDYMRGTEGRAWDDDRRNMATSIVPSGTASRPLTLRVKNDCLVLSYAALSYRTSG